MKKQKTIMESLSKEKLKEVETMISTAKDPTVKHLMKQMLFLTHEELEVIRREMEKMID